MLTIYRPYIHCSAGQAISAVETISQTIETLQAWMPSNRLRLNPTKTQFIWFVTRQQLATIDLGLLATKYPHFTFSSSVCDLEVTLQQELTFVRHINLLCRSCYYQLRQLGLYPAPSHQLPPLPLFTPLSRFDYCSAIYEGLPICRLKCLGRVLRTAARLVGRIPRFSRVSAYMQDVLHWLPSRQRIVYRVTALVRRKVWHHSISGNSVATLLLLSVVSHCALLRSRKLLVPRTRTVIRQRRAFSVACPTSWNGIPVALRLTPVAHSALFLSGFKTTLFDRGGWAGSAPE